MRGSAEPGGDTTERRSRSFVRLSYGLGVSFLSGGVRVFRPFRIPRVDKFHCADCGMVLYGRRSVRAHPHYHIARYKDRT